MSGLDELIKDVESEPDPVFRKGMMDAIERFKNMSAEERQRMALPLTMSNVPTFKWETHEFVANKSGSEKKKLKR